MASGQTSEAEACTGACPSGKYGSKSGHSSEAGASCSETFTFNGTGVELDGENCITDGPERYSAHEEATITAVAGGALYVVGTFETATVMPEAAEKYRIERNAFIVDAAASSDQKGGAMGDGGGSGCGSGSGDACEEEEAPEPPAPQALDVLTILTKKGVQAEWKNVQYYGSFAPPHGLVLNAGETFTWSTVAGGRSGFKLCLCDDKKNYQALVGTTCATYSNSTCPVGHWHDASNTRCVPCDVLNGRIGNGILGATTEAAGCKAAAFLFSGAGAESLGDSCATDGEGRYDINEDATLTVVAPGELFTLGTFSTGNAETDYLSINGIRYAGANAPPSGMRVNASDSIRWKTGATIDAKTYAKNIGFVICVCDTLQPYRVLMSNSCVKLTATTCPPDYWGDTVTSACVPCGSSKTSPAGSTSAAHCVCSAGTWGTTHCTPCLVGSTSASGATTQSSCVCEAGYFGAPGQLCVACDSSAGRVSNGKVGQNAEVDACRDASFTFTSGVDLELTSSDCLTDGPGPYLRSYSPPTVNLFYMPSQSYPVTAELGVATALVAGVAWTTGAFDVYEEDSLTINGNKIASATTSAIAIAQGDEVQWQTSSSVLSTSQTYDGFSLCFCPTSNPYTLLIGDMECVTYTNTSCPAGFWNDQSTCIACEAGKFGTGAGLSDVATACAKCPQGKFGITAGATSAESGCRSCPPWGKSTVEGQTTCSGTSQTHWVQADRSGLSCDDVCLRNSGTGATCDASRGQAVTSVEKFKSIVAAVGLAGATPPATCSNYGATTGPGYAAIPGQGTLCGFTDEVETFSCSEALDVPHTTEALGYEVTQLCCCSHGWGTASSDIMCALGASDCVAGMAYIAGQCVTCDSGRWSSSGSTACTDCGLGYYASSPQSTACTACAFDTVTGINFQASECTQCEKGRVRDQAAVFCSACGGGTRKNVSSGTCIDCLEGEVAQPSSEVCTTCESGMVPDVTKCITISAANRDCVAGQIVTGRSTCADCAPGTFTATGSLDTCALCPLGFYANASGLTNCTACALDTVSGVDTGLKPGA